MRSQAIYTWKCNECGDRQCEFRTNKELPAGALPELCVGTAKGEPVLADWQPVAKPFTKG